MKYSDLKGNKTVSTSSADTVGKVAGFLLDPATRSIRALVLKKTNGGSYARWSDLAGVGHDAVTVPDSSVIVESGEGIDDLSGKEHVVLKKRVLATTGDELGKVRDLDFDPETGAVNYLVVDKHEVKADRLRGVGSYAVVVDAQ